ncbi:MAG: hypothetical protein ACREPV_03170 [Lysobacter sp.]
MNLDRDLPFRGGRNYLQSATLFDDILLLRGDAVTAVDFKFNKKTDRQVHYQSVPPESESTLVAIWRDSAATVYVVEREQEIVESVPYDEETLVDGFSFKATGVEVPRDIGGFTTMEAIVAAFKALLHRTVVTHKPKVVFVRARLSLLPGLPVEVRYSRRIGEFYQGEICSKGKAVGQIFFGEWK